MSNFSYARLFKPSYLLALAIVFTTAACDSENIDNPPQQLGQEAAPAQTPDTHTTTTVLKPDASSEKPELNLSLPNDVASNPSEQEDFSEQETLPDLFEKKAKDKKTIVGGKIINDPEIPDLYDSVRGAEVTIELKTD